MKYFQNSSFDFDLKITPLEVNIDIITVIPVHNEGDISSLLNSLLSTQNRDFGNAIIFVINKSDKINVEIEEKNLLSNSLIEDYKKKFNENNVNILNLNISFPEKDAGVGMARKFGMDLAAYYFFKNQNFKGIINCLDADCEVDRNYFNEIHKYFLSNPKINAASIYFEHDLTLQNSEAILKYELYLRYYIHSIRYTGHPFAYQTVGSSMVCRADAYIKQGGMNKRKAGEDFYFLQKMMYLGDFGEIKSTKVIPSSRYSERVPFGTGRAMLDYDKDRSSISAYHAFVFEDLKTIISNLQLFFKYDNHILLIINDLNPISKLFLMEYKFPEKLSLCKNNAGDLIQFRKRFFQTFDLFFIMKWVHFADNELNIKVELEEGLKWLFGKEDFKFVFRNLHEALIFLRAKDSQSAI